MKHRVVRSNRRGQAQVEYILLIGLVVIFILGALIGFRGAVKGFICKVSVAIGGEPIGDCASETSPAPEVAPAPQSSPSAVRPSAVRPAAVRPAADTPVTDARPDSNPIAR